MDYLTNYFILRLTSGVIGFFNFAGSRQGEFLLILTFTIPNLKTILSSIWEICATFQVPVSLEICAIEQNFMEQKHFFDEKYLQLIYLHLLLTLCNI